MLARIKELASRHRAFAFETTLSGRGHLSMFRKLQAQGYRIHLFYLWLPSIQLAIQRVRDRVQRGGHSVPEEDIRRRFGRGLKNLFLDYLPLLDDWTLLDNSGKRPQMIASANEGHIQIIASDLFHQTKEGWE